MLYSVESGRYVEDIPHKSAYERWINRIAPDELSTIRRVLNERIDGDEIHTSSWMPGKDWTGSVFMPIYETACQRDEDAAAMCFGLILWDVLLHRGDVWGFGRYERSGFPISGLTYFRLQNPPPK